MLCFASANLFGVLGHAWKVRRGAYRLYLFAEPIRLRCALALSAGLSDASPRGKLNRTAPVADAQLNGCALLLVARPSSHPRWLWREPVSHKVRPTIVSKHPPPHPNQHHHHHTHTHTQSILRYIKLQGRGKVSIEVRCFSALQSPVALVNVRAGRGTLPEAGNLHARLLCEIFERGGLFAVWEIDLNFSTAKSGHAESAI